MWVLGISALVGNLFVIGWRFIPRARLQKKNRVESVLVSNLALADFLMGIYMVLIASADMRYRGTYVYFAEDWQRSFLCKFAGFLSVLSSEASVFFLTALSVDRFLCVVFPLHQIRLRRKSLMVTVACVWLSTFAFSILPVVAFPIFGDAFYGRSGVCLALPLTTELPQGWQYSIFLFIGVNLLSVSVIALCYACIYVSVKRSSGRVQKSAGSKNNTEEIKFATRMAFLVFTNFFCWMPIITMGVLAQTGVFISGDIYAFTAVLILPLNSALNPYLYTILTREVSLSSKKPATGSSQNSGTPMQATTNVGSNGKASGQPSQSEGMF